MHSIYVVQSVEYYSKFCSTREYLDLISSDNPQSTQTRKYEPQNFPLTVPSIQNIRYLRKLKIIKTFECFFSYPTIDIYTFEIQYINRHRKRHHFTSHTDNQNGRAVRLYNLVQIKKFDDSESHWGHYITLS